MLSFFETIIEYIQIIWEFVINLIKSLISLVTAVLTAVAVPSTAALYVFAPLGACVLATMAVSVLKLIIGRDNK